MSDPKTRQWFSRFVRLSSSPGAYLDQMLIIADIDGRVIPPSITTPTLVLHRRDDTAISVGQGQPNRT